MNTFIANLDNLTLSTFSESVFSEDKKMCPWLPQLLNKQKMKLDRFNHIKSCVEVISIEAIDYSKEPYSTLGAIFNEVITERIIQSIPLIKTLEIDFKRGRNSPEGRIAIIYKEPVGDAYEYQSNIAEINYFFINLLTPYHSSTIRASYWSGEFCFDLSLSEDKELAMDFVEFN